MQNNMKKLAIAYFILLAALISGCRDYVEIDPVGNGRELIYTSDYRALTNNYTIMENGWSYPLISCDDAEFSESYADLVSDIWGRVYTWNDFFFESDNQDADWSNLYKSIYNCNVVSDGVMGSVAGTMDEKQEILAEARVHRAFAYLTLVNMYAPHYNTATASTDNAVPLLLTSDLYASLKRATVANVYKQIITDLTEALKYLPKVAEFNVLPSKASAYALLARAYLYMGDYSEALSNAQASLDLQSSLLDLNQYASNPYSYPVKLENPEILLSKQATFSFTGSPLNKDVLDLLTDNDLRYDVYTAPGNLFSPNHSGRSFAIQLYSSTNGINVGPSVPEMMLIKAECLAREGDETKAIETLNTLRSKRFNSSTSYNISLREGENALTYVLTERRIELMGRGFRWFDQKRLNLEEGRQMTVTRTFDSQTYSLEPNSEGYVYPIFQEYINKNPELGE
jgi:tetratricopeptide (TPR) repeat protein